jgi:DNA-binding NtrC family response regulator
MNHSNPVLICDETEEFRILIRDMLTKNGFFHIMEASTPKEVLSYLKLKNNFLVLIDSKLFSQEILTFLNRQKDFLFFINDSDEKAVQITSRVGLKRIISHPLHSRKLMNKINSIN